MHNTTCGHNGYSATFLSGFRAMASRTVHHRASSIHSLPGQSSSTSSSSREQRSTTRSIRQRVRTRPASMICNLHSSDATKPRSPATKHQRRSSIVEITSRLFEKMTPNPAAADADAKLGRGASRRRRTRGHQQNTSDMSEVWITAGGPIVTSQISAVHVIADNVGPSESIDPFASSPDSQSFFVDLNDSPLPSRSKRTSFLSMSGSSRDSSSFLSFNFPLRGRPTSVQTMPPPSSRRSSFLYRAPSRDHEHAYSPGWAVEEEVEEFDSNLLPPIDVQEKEEWINDPAEIDWRQFHIELLGEHV